MYITVGLEHETVPIVPIVPTVPRGGSARLPSPVSCPPSPVSRLHTLRLALIYYKNKNVFKLNLQRICTRVSHNDNTIL